MKAASRLPVDPENSAKIVGLRYLHTIPPGITRRRAGRGWVYFNPDGKRLTSPGEIKRIKSLVIPPMWSKVWISPLKESHLQAIGYDARGRRQYRYHPDFRNIRDATKFHRLNIFAASLPALRQKVEEDLKLRGLPKQKVLAALVRLFDETSIRVGNPEYARDNRSFGLTTLLNDHVEVNSSRLIFKFKGKSGVEHKVGVADRRLARIIRACQELPGEELFQYIDDEGETRPVRSEDVNTYIRDASGEDLSTKDFRTWNGTCAAFLALREMPCPESETHARTCVVAAVKQVAAILGNRPATCRKYYIHPAIIEAFFQGGDPFDKVLESVVPSSARDLERLALSPEEELVLKIVSRYRPEIFEKRTRRRAAA